MVKRVIIEVWIFICFNVFVALASILFFLIFFISWKSNNTKTKWASGTGIWKTVSDLPFFLNSHKISNTAIYHYNKALWKFCRSSQNNSYPHISGVEMQGCIVHIKGTVWMLLIHHSSLLYTIYVFIISLESLNN